MKKNNIYKRAIIRASGIKPREIIGIMEINIDYEKHKIIIINSVGIKASYIFRKVVISQNTIEVFEDYRIWGKKYYLRVSEVKDGK